MKKIRGSQRGTHKVPGGPVIIAKDDIPGECQLWGLDHYHELQCSGCLRRRVEEIV